jgi:hypothetical protein
MNRTLTMLLFPLLLTQAAAVAQVVHSISFASSGNVVELTVANASVTQSTDVMVRVANRPDWLVFVRDEHLLQGIQAGGESIARFTFEVDQSAPVGQEETLAFVLSTPSGEAWTKQIKVVVSAPDRFELFQNYPNPFNPKTEISYQTSEPGRVTLKVYNVLGQEVATLVDADQPAGAHRVEWNAGTFASGVYMYRLSAGDDNGRQVVLQRAMMLVK